MTERIPFGDEDRERLREAGRLLDAIDAAVAEDDLERVLTVVSGTRTTYLGGYLAGLADREAEPT